MRPGYGIQDVNDVWDESKGEAVLTKGGDEKLDGEEKRLKEGRRRGQWEQQWRRNGRKKGEKRYQIQSSVWEKELDKCAWCSLVLLFSGGGWKGRGGEWRGELSCRDEKDCHQTRGRKQLPVR